MANLFSNVLLLELIFSNPWSIAGCKCLSKIGVNPPGQLNFNNIHTVMVQPGKSDHNENRLYSLLIGHEPMIPVHIVASF